MICQRCRKAVPDESAFCLSCGARLVPAARLVPVNGGEASPRGAPARAPGAVSPSAAATTPEASRSPSGRQPYALSFGPIADERIRYRVARWVCEHAPAYALPEVQEGLGRGDFVTVLALSREEADAARQRVQDLGVAPGLARLAPATAAEMMIPERRGEPVSKGPRGIRAKDWVSAIVGLIALFMFGLVMMRLYGGRGF